MSFKKVKDGWEYDPKGEARIPSAKRNPFEQTRRTEVIDEYGHPVNAGEDYWKRIIEDANKKDKRS